tara:strand:+ start:2589 stop:3593 length:1005 start_codon:yes stop_codon:yes gene_type:complete
MCKLTKKQIDAKLKKKRKRDTSFAAYVRTTDLIPNVCGSMMDGKKMLSHWIGEEGCRRRFTPCRVKGVHPITGTRMSMHLHHINEDGSDDRKHNLVRLCPYCHEHIHLLLGRRTLYTKSSFISWFIKNCTNPKSFYVLMSKGLLPSYIPANPPMFYKLSGEWDGGWQEFVDEDYYLGHLRYDGGTGDKTRAMCRKPKSAKQHFALLVLNKIHNRREWDTLIASMGGFEECGYLRSCYFLKYYRDEWLKFSLLHKTNFKGEKVIRFHYLGKKAPGYTEDRVDSFRKELAKKIKKENKAKPLTDKELSKIFGVSTKKVNMYRRELEIPSSVKRKGG